MIEENIERELDKVMANEVPTKENTFKETLSIDEDTSFDIYYNIYNDGNTDYLYIKMSENTAVAPFYYNRSFTLEELQALDDIFKTCDLQELKDHIKSLFEEKKIKLIYDNNKENIKMELSVVCFVTKYKIYFKLYKQMIPEEIQDEQLLYLYELEKNKIKMIKELVSIFNNSSNQEEKAFGDKLKQLIFQFEIPGIEEGLLNSQGKSEKSIRTEESIPISKSIPMGNEHEFDTMSIQSSAYVINNTNYKIFTNARKGKRYHLNKENNTIELLCKNITNENWPMNDIKLICNQEASTIKCTVTDLVYDVEKGQDGQFKVIFDPNDLKSGMNAKCVLELFLRGEKIEKGLCELYIGFKKNKGKSILKESENII